MNKCRTILRLALMLPMKCGHRSFITSGNGVSMRIFLIVIAIMKYELWSLRSIVIAIYGSVYTASQLKC